MEAIFKATIATWCHCSTIRTSTQSCQAHSTICLFHVTLFATSSTDTISCKQSSLKLRRVASPIGIPMNWQQKSHRKLTSNSWSKTKSWGNHSSRHLRSLRSRSMQFTVLSTCKMKESRTSWGKIPSISETSALKIQPARNSFARSMTEKSPRWGNLVCLRTSRSCLLSSKEDPWFTWSDLTL